MMKRTRAAALLTGALCISMCCKTSWGFTTFNSLIPSAQFRVQAVDHHHNWNDMSIVPTRSNMELAATKRGGTSSGLHKNQNGRLGKEEEEELLRQAVELRRLSTLEKEMALASPTKTLPLLSVRAKAAGYGDELNEYEDAKYHGQLAREALVTRNMGLVHYSVTQILGSKKAYRLNSLSRDDLVQEGAIGLARAVDKWNPAIGGRFSSYAVYWIRAAVFRCIAERDDVVRVPEYVSRSISQINKAAKRLGMDIDGDAMGSSSWKTAQQAKELAEEAGLTDKQLAEALKIRGRRYSGGYVPFHSWMQQGKDLSTDVPANMKLEEDPSSSAIQTEHLRTTLSKFLRPKEMEALFWRYGLVEDTSSNTDASSMEAPIRQEGTATTRKGSVGAKSSAAAMPPTKGKWGEAMAFTEVAKRMQVSAEYTRRLCHKGLEKLKNAAEDGRLEPALLAF